MSGLSRQASGRAKPLVTTDERDVSSSESSLTCKWKKKFGAVWCNAMPFARERVRQAVRLQGTAGLQAQDVRCVELLQENC